MDVTDAINAIHGLQHMPSVQITMDIRIDSHVDDAGDAAGDEEEEGGGVQTISAPSASACYPRIHLSISAGRQKEVRQTIREAHKQAGIPHRDITALPWRCQSLPPYCNRPNLLFHAGLRVCLSVCLFVCLCLYLCVSGAVPPVVDCPTT